jgi:hypothetical protein
MSNYLGGGGGSLTVAEADGSPSVSGVTSIVVTNGTLTDSGGGAVALAIGANAALSNLSGVAINTDLKWSGDVGIGRFGVGQLKVTNGDTGYGDLLVNRLTLVQIVGAGSGLDMVGTVDFPILRSWNGAADALGFEAASFTRASPTTDSAPNPALIKAANAWPGASTNPAGGNTILAGGLGKRILTIVLYSHASMAGSTVTVTANGTANVLTEGSEWYAATSNNDTATSLADAIANIQDPITTNPVMSAIAVGAVVRVFPGPAIYSLTIAKTAADAGMTATSGADGNVNFPAFYFGRDAYTPTIVGIGLPGTYPGPYFGYSPGIINSYGPQLIARSSTFGDVGIGGTSRFGGGVYGGIYMSGAYQGVGWDGGPLLVMTSANIATLLGNSGSNAGDLVTSGAITAVAGGGTVPFNGVIRVGVYKRTWTNAEVQALGANLTGDIKVATLPAKTIVRNAYVVIDSQASVVDTLTVAMGRTSAAYIDYIVASNAMVAANTVYGDGTPERGTNLTGYDIPSYTAAVDVYLHFIATSAGGKKLADVLGCTGTIYLLTETLP